MWTPELSCPVEKVWRVCPAPEGTPSLSCPCPGSWGSPYPAHSPGPHSSPLGHPSLAPETLQQGRCPAPHHPARWWPHHWATPSFFLKVKVRGECLRWRDQHRTPCRQGHLETPSRHAVQIRWLLLLWYHVMLGFLPRFPTFDWLIRKPVEFPFL